MKAGSRTARRRAIEKRGQAKKVARANRSGRTDGRAGVLKVPTGIAGFDRLTGGGLPAGRPTLVCGAAGCGKSLFALEFLVRGAMVIGGVAVLTVAGRIAGSGRRRVEQARRLLRLPVKHGTVPVGASLGVAGIFPWRTPNKDFYIIHTALAPPSISPEDWQLRIDGMVDRELSFSYQDLLDRQLTEEWVTLCCVSNVVGGDLIGNAWWSGVLVRDLLAETRQRSPRLGLHVDLMHLAQGGDHTLHRALLVLHQQDARAAL